MSVVATTHLGADESAALDLMDRLLDQPMNLSEIMQHFHVTRSRARRLIELLREDICPAFGVIIPHPLPNDDHRYRVTGDWAGDDGAGLQPASEHALRHVMSRMKRLHADVEIVLPNLEPGSVAHRQANFLRKHLAHIVGTLNEIGGE